MKNITNYVEKYLGQEVKDKVTGLKGVVTSVTFDLYGCIQILITPKIDKDGKTGESWWIDTIRVDITSTEPVMNLPEFNHRANVIDEDPPGPANKPTF